MKNKLLLTTLFLLAAYWLVGSLLPVPFISLFSSTLIFIFGVFVLWQYGPTAAEVIFLGRRNWSGDPKDKSHLGIYGTALLAFGAIYTGIYSWIWNIHGTPEEWVGTHFSAFGRATMAAGFWLMWYSPPATYTTKKRATLVFAAVIVAGSIIAGILIGLSITGTRIPN